MKEDLNLGKVLLKLHSEEEILKVFKELLTNTEFDNLQNRLKIAVELLNKTNYKDITRKTGASSATIAKLSNSIKDKDSVLKTVLQKLS